MKNGQPFRVVWGHKASEAVKVLRAKAKELGRSGAFARSIKAVQNRLLLDPLNFGEVYRTRGSINEFFAVHEFLGVHFAVDIKRNLVFVRELAPMSGFKS